MPLPKPSAKETQEDFISRFMGDTAMMEEYPKQDQRAAVAYSTWRSENAMCAICAKDFKDWNVYKDHMKSAHQQDLLKLKNEAADAYKTWRSKSGNPVVNEDENDLKEYLLKVMGVPAGMQPRMNSRGQVGRPVTIRFIEPGLVHYDDVGTVLVSKQTLDRMNVSMTGRPIFNQSHREVSNDDFSTGESDGVAQNDAHFNPESGWFEVTGLFWDEETMENVKKGYNVSCAYDVKKWGPGGIHNNIPYDREVLDGEYTHLAIVDNPRYERARIIYNQGGHMKLKFWQKEKDKEPVASEMELTNAKVAIGEKEVPLEEIINGFKAEEARKAELGKKVGIEDLIDIDGKKVSVGELLNGYKAHLKNESVEEMKKSHKDGKHDDEEMDNCPMCNADDDDEEEKKKKDEERKNAEAKEKDEKEKEERENARDHADKKHTSRLSNCLECRRENDAYFVDLKNAARSREGKFAPPNLRTAEDKVAEGNKRYGAK